MSLSDIAPLLRSFVRAVQAGDAAAVRAMLGKGAIITEEGDEYSGDTVDAWLEGLSLREIESIRLIDEAKRNGETVLTVFTIEYDANGEAADCERDWHFTVQTGRVVALRILRRAIPALPSAVAAFVRATNMSDLEGLLSTFVEDALINDQLTDHWGKEEIREWAAHEIVGMEFKICVADAVEHHGHIIVTANVNGNFDRRGLPDPLVLTFYFSILEDRIVQLIILRNQSGT
jgi:hypothetical protein